MKGKSTNTDKRATSYDIWMGKPANGLIWDFGRIDYQNPPTDESFYSANGRKYLISGSSKHMKSRQKDRPAIWYSTVYNSVNHMVTEEGECDVFTWETPLGKLIGKRHNNHFSEYPIKTIEDIDIWTYIYSNISFSLNRDWLERTNIGELKSLGLNWSPVQQLMQFDMGLENFYYFLVDAPEKMETLLDVMQKRCVERLKLCLSNFPDISYIYWGENTSSSSISPSYYQRLTLPHIKEYAELAHNANKRLIIHMCGLLKDLLDSFILTGMDGIHSATPPPFGDAPYELIREKFKKDFTILGRFNAQLWMGKSVSEIQANLKKSVYPELLESPFLLMVTDDAIPDIPYENVMNLYEALENIRW